jgi:hypothetical protein
MDALPWDEIPKNTVFAISQFDEGPHKGSWGIMARLADGRRFWAALGEPADVVAAPNQVMAQTILTNLREYSEMSQTPPDPQVEERLRRATSSEPSVPLLLPVPAPVEERLRSFDEREHFDGILSAINEDAERCRVEELGELEKEWRRRLAVGKRGACICGQCRHEFRYKVTKILDWYEESIGYVPTDLKLDARRLLDLLATP